MAAIKTILIVGGSGFVGTNLVLRLRENYKVFATFYRHPIQIPGVGFFPLEFTNENWIKRLIYTIKPNVVIFAGGSDNLEWSQNNTRETEAHHVAGAAIISKTAELFGPKFIYLSNCYTFDGVRGNYHETDTILPSTVLGKAKLNGENYIRGKCLNYIIVRSSPVYGRGNGLNLSFLDRLRMKLDRNERIELNHDILHSFAPVDSLTDLVERAMNSGIRNRALHLGGLTKVTYFEFGQEFAKKFDYDPALIIPKKMTSKFETKGNSSPSNYLMDYSLNSTQAIETLKIQPFLLEEGLDLIQKKSVTIA